MWLHSAERFMNRDDVKQVILVISAEDREYFQHKFGANIAILGVQVVEGGAERADSVQQALEKVKDEIDFVAVHDAARPCIADEWIDGLRRRRTNRRRDPRHARREHAQASRRQQTSPKPSAAKACGKPKRRKSSAASC